MLKVFQRTPGGNWYISGTIAGQRIRESTGTRSKRLAEAQAVRIESEWLERRILGKRATLTFAEAALTYLETGGEARFIDPLLVHFGAEMRLLDIDNEAVNGAAKALYPGRGPGTVNRQVITPISAIYSLAADNGLVDHRRFRRRKEPPSRPHWLTPGQAKALLGELGPHVRPLVLFLLGTGARTGEALPLQRNALYLDSGQAWIGATGQGDLKTGEGRMVRMPPRVVRELRVLDLPETGAVFRTPKGKPYVLRQNGGGQISGAFRNACRAAELPDQITPHTLRHTWATWYYAQTRDFGGLLDLGGWGRADTANIYRKIAPDTLAAELDAHGWDFRGPQTAPAGTIMTQVRRA